ncbi:type III pantothenate kinase [Diplocloster hominis]|uniref:type III pantothenate kinase n=1 Tax=Diplocloster hominis TaxID=3079010 RepID=UPI0031BA5BFC
MLLVIDVGNTNITLGVFDDDELIGTFRMTTKLPRTSDEYGIFICNLVEHRNLKVTDITDIIIASVVPDIMYSLTSAIIKYFKVSPIVVGPGIKTGIKIVTENPKEIGADRIVDAVAAYELYGGPVLVLDFGTATTYDLITAEGAFIAGVTSPGIRISAKALWEDAAKLPEIEIKKPDSILAKETISSMQAGLVYGHIGQTEYIIRHMIAESGLTNVKVVATGGLGKLIADSTECIDIYEPMLTLQGLRLIYEKCKNR